MPPCAKAAGLQYARRVKVTLVCLSHLQMHDATACSTDHSVDSTALCAANSLRTTPSLFLACRSMSHMVHSVQGVMQCISNQPVDRKAGRCKLTVTSAKPSMGAADITSLCQCAWAVWQEPWWGTASCVCLGSASYTEPALSGLAVAARSPAHTLLRPCGTTLSAAAGTPLKSQIA